MSLAAFLSPSRIRVGVAAASKREAIPMLADLVAADLGVEADPLKQALHAREKLGSTAIGNGVVLPHAKTSAVSAPVASMLILSSPLDCTTPDDVPADIFIGFFAPAENGDLEQLAHTVKALRSEALLRDLRAARSPEEVLAALPAPAAGPLPE